MGNRTDRGVCRETTDRVPLPVTHAQHGHAPCPCPMPWPGSGIPPPSAFTPARPFQCPAISHMPYASPSLSFFSSFSVDTTSTLTSSPRTSHIAPLLSRRHSPAPLLAPSCEVQLTALAPSPSVIMPRPSHLARLRTTAAAAAALLLLTPVSATTQPSRVEIRQDALAACAAQLDGQPAQPTPSGFQWSGAVRTYYVSAEEVQWDYAPSGWDNWLGVRSPRPFLSALLSSSTLLPPTLLSSSTPAQRQHV